MLIRESIEKTKNFFKKRLVNLKSILFGGYQKLPKPPLLKHPFSCSFGKTKDQQKDQYYADSCNAWESDQEETKNRRKMGLPDQNQSPVKNKQEEMKKEEKKMGSSRMDKRQDQLSRKLNPEGYALAQKMKQLDMMDAGDMEHVLDVEEALHYYSRLKSPVYLDIVDKFFVDMYSEFPVPQSPARINSSKRRRRLR